MFCDDSGITTMSAGSRAVPEVATVLLEHGVLQSGVLPEALLGGKIFLFLP